MPDVELNKANESHSRTDIHAEGFGFHHDFVFFEQPGAGHWWDVSPEPGADCVDWAPMFDFFARHRLPADGEVREVDFSTANPGVSARCHWAEIGAQVGLLPPEIWKLSEW